MIQNVGGFDRIFRIILGVVILAAGLYFQSWWGIIGLVPLGTGLMNSCPLYIPMKISTLKKKLSEKISK